MDFSTYKNILVYIELADAKIAKISLEVLGAAKKIASKTNEELTAVITGSGVADGAAEALVYGADKVIVVDSADYAVFNLDVQTEILAQIAAECKPSTILLGATQNGKDLAGRLASRLDTGCVTDAFGVDVDGAGNIVWTCAAYGGTVYCDMVIDNARPQIGSLRSAAFKKNEPVAGKTGEIIAKDIKVSPEAVKVKVVEAVKEISETVNLEEAEVIVTGGRGMGSAENYELIKELAKLLGGEVGATRPVTEAGWVPKIHQVGQSGKIVSPKLYIACGVSGAVQHTSGMTGSDYIVAVNKDEEAPIFEVSDIGIVANAMDALPLMINEIRKIKES
ncbi:MAG: electron transfer flavoprotein subunit alpha/FixB family protein [Fusobacteriaceae bacterium]|jgi:electron transfer flavoprotein alpha subunit|nr:electron transfer flavoprotein subunit alpha/FixB family protein [Fusobacteriaceae bacterium]